jgi:hypothetical protein
MDDDRPGDGPTTHDPAAGADPPPTEPVASPLPPPPPLPGAGPPAAAVAQPASNGQAVAALVLGIVGLVLFWTVWLGLILGTLAIVFGALGRSKAKQGAPNKSMATAGLVLGIVAVAASVLILVLFFALADDAQTVLDRVEFCLDHPNDPMC